MQPKALRYSVYFLSALVLLIAINYPLAYAGLVDFDRRLFPGTPFYALARHLSLFVRAHDPVFLVHVLGGMTALVMGPFQFSPGLRNARPALHRKLGYAYFTGIFAGSLGGLMVAPHAWGGPITQWGFGLLALVWLGSGIRGMSLAIQGRIDEHQHWMRLSYALTLASVSLRLQMPLLLVSGLSEEHVYQTVAWSCWLPQLAWWLR